MSAVAEIRDGAHAHSHPFDVVPEDELVILAAEANKEYAQMTADLFGAIGHAIACGLILKTAHQLVGDGAGRPGQGFRYWCDKNLSFRQEYALQLIRLATYKDSLPEEVYKTYADARGHIQQPSVARALTYLRGLPPVRDCNRGRRLSDAIRSEVRRLKIAGATFNDIAALTGISVASAVNIAHPDHQRRAQARQLAQRRERNQLRRIKERQAELAERKRLAMEAGGLLGEAYGLLRRTMQKTDAALGELPSPAAESLRLAISSLHRAEDLFGLALRGLPPTASLRGLSR